MSDAIRFTPRFARRRPVIAKVGHRAVVRVKKAYKVCTKWSSRDRGRVDEKPWLFDAVDRMRL